MTLAQAVLREARPKQWVKNVLVFAAPAAAGVLDNGSYAWRAVVLFIAFCLASSGTYFWNDILDVEADRNHPTKCRRPIASGAIPLGIARVLGVLLILAGIGLSFVPRWQAGLVVIGYVVLTTAYSVVLKHVAVVDLVTVASGFILRAVGGAVATDVVMSRWFLLTTSFASLFIVTGKRYGELRDVGDSGETRATLEEYSYGFLRIVLSVSCGAALVTYCIWAFETKEIAGTSGPYYELSIVPMATALLRYTLILEQGHGAAPRRSSPTTGRCRSSARSG
jgi:decaprenyl-phosphate phosphoribosyltransferase